MKRPILAACALAGAFLLFTVPTAAQETDNTQPPTIPNQSQTAQNRAQAMHNQTMTMNGCIAGTGTIDQPFALLDVTVVGRPGGGTATTPQPAASSAENPPVAPTGVAGTGAPVFAATNAYRLTGRDFSAYEGRRVQVVGVITPTAAASGNAAMGAGATVGTGSAGTSGDTEELGPTGAMSEGGSLPQFKVQSVRLLPGGCRE